MRLITKRRINFDNKKLIDQLRKLTNPGDSWMKDIIRDEAAQMGPDFNAVAYVYDKGQMVGWGFVESTWYNRQQNGSCGLFVKRAYRRLGIGRKIIRALAKRSGLNAMTAHPWDEQSMRFFKKFGFKRVGFFNCGSGRIDVTKEKK